MENRYLTSGKFCSWSNADSLVEKAAKLKEATVDGTIRAIYEYVALCIAYDYDKARSLRGGRGYVPNPEGTYERKKGVCFDKASLMCAMLRTDGVPAKLCVGTMNGESHAWVLAYDGKRWLRCDPTITTGRQENREYVERYQL